VIRDQELLHGAALARLIDHGEPVSIRTADAHLSAYLVESGRNRVALLLKLSTRKKSPWQFTFTEGEGAALTALAESHPEHKRLLVFVCHTDGVCCLPHDRLGELIEDPFAPAGQAISVSRAEGQSYRVSGPGKQRLHGTVPVSDWPRIVFD
jgi:hypothetical protein